MESQIADPRGKAVAELLSQTPEAVVERLRALADDLALAYAANTLRGWRADWRIWSEFCARAQAAPLPVTLPLLREFLMDRVAAGRKRATLDRCLSTLAIVHRLVGLPSPMDSMEFKLMWRGLRREYLTARQRQAKGLTMADLQTILATLNPDEPRDVRDAAMLCTAFETMFRRSELISLQVQNLSIETDGSGRLFLAHSKTDQEGVGVLQYVTPSTVDLLKNWMSMANIKEGPIFRSGAHNREHFENPLSDRDVARIFKSRALAAGLDAERVSGHSTRVGATQDLIANNFSAAEIMRQGRWKSERMIVRYSESLNAGRSAMARMATGIQLKPKPK
ncbi:MAG: site-specific integrase [Panacagrimonas sp.]